MSMCVCPGGVLTDRPPVNKRYISNITGIFFFGLGSVLPRSGCLFAIQASNESHSSIPQSQPSLLPCYRFVESINSHGGTCSHRYTALCSAHGNPSLCSVFLTHRLSHFLFSVSLHCSLFSNRCTLTQIQRSSCILLSQTVDDCF